MQNPLQIVQGGPITKHRCAKLDTVQSKRTRGPWKPRLDSTQCFSAGSLKRPDRRIGIKNRNAVATEHRGHR